MRRLTIKGWLACELKYLSGEDTLNLRRLAVLAQSSAPRLRERLALYAIATGKVARLKSFLYDEAFVSELDELSEKLVGSCLDGMNQKMIAALPFRYQKAFGSFRAAHERLDTLNESKRLRWRKTVRLQKEKGLSNADIYHELGLDAGNINAYLKNGDIDRVSLETATMVMKYLITAPDR